MVFARWGSYHGNTPGRPGPVRAQAAPPAVRAVAGPVPARVRRVPVPWRRARLAGPGDRRRARRRAGGRDRRGRAVQRGRVRGRADRGGHAGRRRAAGRLLAGHRGGLPPARRAADRRRGHDRVRADRGLVRDGPLRRPAGHAGRGQGRDVRVLAVRVRGGVRRRSGTTVVRGGGFVHGFTYSHQPVAAAVAREVLRILEAESLVEASAVKGERLLALLARAPRRPPGRGRHPRPRPAGRRGAGPRPASRRRRSRGPRS